MSFAEKCVFEIDAEDIGDVDMELEIRTEEARTFLNDLVQRVSNDGKFVQIVINIQIELIISFSRRLWEGQGRADVPKDELVRSDEAEEDQGMVQQSRQ